MFPTFILLAGLASASDWRAALDAQVAEAWAQHPVEAAAAAKAEPIRTRNGLPRFVGEEVWNPAATPILLERVVNGGEDAATRAALIEAALRSGGDWSGTVAGLLAVEEDAAVRRMLAEVLREAEPVDASVGLPLAAADEDAAVRAAAMRAIGGRPDGATWEPLVRSALSDPDASVREHAARAAGWLGLGNTWSGLEGLLSDSSPDVRLSALRALERLDPVRLEGVPALKKLQQDPDSRVARAAAGLGR